MWLVEKLHGLVGEVGVEGKRLTYPCRYIMSMRNFFHDTCQPFVRDDLGICTGSSWRPR
jgi:hypothetical protein